MAGEPGTHGVPQIGQHADRMGGWNSALEVVMPLLVESM